MAPNSSTYFAATAVVVVVLVVVADAQSNSTRPTIRRPIHFSPNYHHSPYAMLDGMSLGLHFHYHRRVYNSNKKELIKLSNYSKTR